MEQSFLLFFMALTGSKPISTASPKHSLTPFRVFAEHSRYLRAPTSLAILFPSFAVMALHGVGLGTDEDDGHSRCIPFELPGPLVLDILKAHSTVQGEAEQEDGCIGIPQGSQSIIVLLTGSVKQVQDDILACHWQCHGVIVKDSGDVVLWELVLGVGNEEACLYRYVE